MNLSDGERIHTVLKEMGLVRTDSESEAEDNVVSIWHSLLSLLSGAGLKWPKKFRPYSNKRPCSQTPSYCIPASSHPANYSSPETLGADQMISGGGL